MKRFLMPLYLQLTSNTTRDTLLYMLTKTTTLTTSLIQLDTAFNGCIAIIARKAGQNA
jgi:hypothetical protein